MLDYAKIKRLREQLTLTQGEAAARAGFKGENGKARWSDIENGRHPDPHLSTLLVLAEVLGVTIDELLARPAQKRKGSSGALGSKG